MQEFKPFKEGKVREVYDNGDSLIMVATDRISAFDHILKNKITDKGAILTQMSKFWFEFTKDVVPNHMISVDAKDMPEFFGQDRFNGNSMLCKKLEMQATRRTVQSAESDFRRDLLSLISSLSLFIHHLPRLILEIMMRISHSKNQ